MTVSVQIKVHSFYKQQYMTKKKIMQMISFSLISEILDGYINTAVSPQIIMCKFLKVIMQILISILYGISHRKNFPRWITKLRNISGLEFMLILLGKLHCSLMLSSRILKYWNNLLPRSNKYSLGRSLYSCKNFKESSAAFIKLMNNFSGGSWPGILCHV